MEFKEKDRQLTILIEDLYEWHEMFDGTSSTNIIEVPIGKNNIDFFFPNRKKYINDDDLEQKLIADANRFDTIKIEVANGVMDKSGEGVFEVNGFDFDFNTDLDDEEKFALPIEIENNEIGIIAYIVSPDLYEP
jgi:hypothetical protein